MDTDIRFEIERREPFAGGRSFGEVGPYERLEGRVHLALDPDDPANGAVVDLEYAPTTDDGRVAVAADLSILKPAAMDRGNRRLLYGVNNRGNKRTLQFFNDAAEANDPTDEAHAGNGFLMRRGYAVVWSGWQGNLRPGDDRLTVDVPVAEDDGEPITGPMRTEFVADEPGIECVPLSGDGAIESYEAASLDTTDATMTVREYETDPREPVADDAWAFARVEDGEAVPSASYWHYPAGFEPGMIYELVYTARDPLVMGLGFPGVRDLVSALRYEAVDADGVPTPLREEGTGIEKAYAWGTSQSGRFLRAFVYGGWNADVAGRPVFDGISPHVAGGGRVALNERFARPGRFPRQHRDHLFASDQFPFAYEETTDPHTGETDGILARPETDPLVVHVQTAGEYWSRRGSLVHTDPAGEDLGEQEGARVYHFASAPHYSDPLVTEPEEGPHRYPSNPVNTTPFLRALLDALDAWATDGTPPPASRVPTREEGTLVTAAEAAERFPDVPGVSPPTEPNRAYVQDFGPRYDEGIVSTEPPGEDRDREYPVFVPAVDADGNEVAGVPPPEVTVPRATLAGWNLRPEGRAERALASVNGSYFPFPATEAARLDRGDPRPSIEERYPTDGRYVREIARAADRLVEEGFLLSEDADRYVERAANRD